MGMGCAFHTAPVCVPAMGCVVMIFTDSGANGSLGQTRLGCLLQGMLHGLLNLLFSGVGIACMWPWFGSIKSSWSAMLLRNWRSSTDVRLSFNSSSSLGPLPSSHRPPLGGWLLVSLSAELTGWASAEEWVAGQDSSGTLRTAASFCMKACIHVQAKEGSDGVNAYRWRVVHVYRLAYSVCQVTILEILKDMSSVANLSLPQLSHALPLV